MINRVLSLLLFVFILSAPREPASTTEAQTGRAIAIRNVTVIPVTGASPIANATVVITGERITAVGPATKVKIPQGARVINGTGKFLLPGFIEMHAHLSKTRASSMGLFIANGITTLRDMGGDHEELLRWRREIRSGTRLGPRILMAGPYLESARNIERMRKDPPSERVEPFERTRIGVGSPDEARRVVADLAKREIDFIKIRTVQDRETYLALNKAADEHGLKLVGHVTGIPPEVVLASGQDGVEHLFYPSLTSKNADERIAFWKKFAERGIVVVPTLVALFEGTFPPTDKLRAVVEDEKGAVDPRRPYISKYLVLDWREQVLEATDQRRQTLRKNWDDIARRDLREMHQAGVELLVGSDVAVLNVFPGYSLHDEMALFVSELGMTPGEVIERATRRSAKFLGLADQIGTVEEGKIADLVLLDANPLDDIHNTKRISAVILRGTVYEQPGIKRILDDVRAAPDIRVDDWGRTSSVR